MASTSTFSYEDLEVLRNRTLDEIAVGDRASIERTLTAADIQLFAAMSGDINPQHIDAEFAASTRFHGVIAGIVVGARESRIASCAVALVAARRLAQHAALSAGASQETPLAQAVGVAAPPPSRLELRA